MIDLTHRELMIGSVSSYLFDELENDPLRTKIVSLLESIDFGWTKPSPVCGDHHLLALHLLPD